LAKVSQAGAFLGTIGLGFAPGDLVMNPVDGTLWVSDWSNDLVEHITTTGAGLGSFSTGLSGGFAGIGLAPDGNSLYVATGDSTVIRQFDLNGNQLGDFNISSPSIPWLLTVVPAPEPSTGGLALLGLGLLISRRKRPPAI
jgi:MYXO-CTERM domain-containing protein